MTLDQLLEQFEKEFEIDLDRDLTWPEIRNDIKDWLRAHISEMVVEAVGDKQPLVRYKHFSHPMEVTKETIYIIPRGKDAVMIHGTYYMTFKGKDALMFARFEARLRSKDMRKKDKSLVVQILEL